MVIHVDDALYHHLEKKIIREADWLRWFTAGHNPHIIEVRSYHDTHLKS
jgi:hypothetical protein